MVLYIVNGIAQKKKKNILSCTALEDIASEREFKHLVYTQRTNTEFLSIKEELPSTEVLIF